MKPKHLYLGLSIVGTVLPLWRFAPFLRDHGLSFAALFDQLFSTPVGGFFGMDVIVSSVVLWVLVYFDGRRERVGHLWVPILASLIVGVSFGIAPFPVHARGTA